MQVGNSGTVLLDTLYICHDSDSWYHWVSDCEQVDLMGHAASSSEFEVQLSTDLPVPNSLNHQ